MLADTITICAIHDVQEYEKRLLWPNDIPAECKQALCTALLPSRSCSRDSQRQLCPVSGIFDAQRQSKQARRP